MALAGRWLESSNTDLAGYRKKSLRPEGPELGAKRLLFFEGLNGGVDEELAVEFGHVAGAFALNGK